MTQHSERTNGALHKKKKKNNVLFLLLSYLSSHKNEIKDKKKNIYMNESIKYKLHFLHLYWYTINEKHPWSKSVDYTIQSLELDGTWNIEMQ